MADIAKMDEKNATLTMKLSAKSGFRSDTKFPDVSAIQWGAINAICADQESEIGQKLIAMFRDHVIARQESAS